MGLENMISKCWPEWEIVKELGKGSFGTVYEVKKTEGSIEIRAAIKIISIPQDSSELDTYRSEGMSLEETRTTLYEVVTEFENEIQLMQKFKGTQNIVSVEDYKIIESKETVGWTILIRMELLTPFLAYTADKKLTENEVIKVGIDICNALELCEMANVIHRDIKPQNIFVNSFGNFKLGDFGVAKTIESTTGSLSQKGTLNYMAPEVYSGEKYDKTADIYSLGIVLYNLMNNGRMPFVDPDKQLVTFADREEALKKRMEGNELPAPKYASEGFANVLFRALAPCSAGRFSSAKEFRLALEALAQGTYQIVDLDRTVSLRKTDNIQMSSGTIHSKGIEDKSNKKKAIAIFSAGCAIIAIVIIGIIFAVGGGKKQTSSDDAVARNTAASNENIDDSKVNEGTSAENNEKQTENAVASSEASSGEVPVETKPIETESVFDEVNAINTIIADVDKLVENEDYTSAIIMLNDGLVTYSDNTKLKAKHDEVTKKYIKVKDKEIDRYEENKEYYEAIACIDAMGEIIGIDDEMITRRVGFMREYLLTCEDRETDNYFYVREEYIKTNINECGILYKDKEFIDAFNLMYDLLTIVGKDDRIEKEFEKCEDEYVAIVSKNSLEMIEDNKLFGAFEEIKRANDIFPSNRDVKKVMSVLEDNNYIYLYNYRPYEIENDYGDKYKTYESINISGITYEKGFRMEATNTGLALHYRLQHNYDKISFVCGPEDGQNRYNAKAYIYADGKMIYSIDVGRTSIATSHEVDISDCDELVIQIVNTESRWLTSVAFGEVKLYRDYENHYKKHVLEKK